MYNSVASRDAIAKRDCMGECMKTAAAALAARVSWFRRLIWSTAALAVLGIPGQALSSPSDIVAQAPAIKSIPERIRAVREQLAASGAQDEASPWCRLTQ